MVLHIESLCGLAGYWLGSQTPIFASLSEGVIDQNRSFLEDCERSLFMSSKLRLNWLFCVIRYLFNSALCFYFSLSQNHILCAAPVISVHGHLNDKDRVVGGGERCLVLTTRLIRCVG